MTKQMKSSTGIEQIPGEYKLEYGYVIPREWQIVRFDKCFHRLTQKNAENNQNVLTISAQQGLISQLDYYNTLYASEDKTGYFLLQKGDFAYNKSYSTDYAYGAIKQLEKYEKGIVSPLYICFSANKHTNTDFYRQYFEAGRFNREIYKIAQEGARNHGLLNVSTPEFFSAALVYPPVAEQKKIAEILTHCDKVIELKQRLIEEEKKKNQWLLEFVYKLSGVQHTKIPLKNCGKWFSGGTPDKRNNDYWDHGTIKWVSSQEVKETHIQDTTYKITHKAIAESTTAIAPAYSLLLVTRSGILKHSIPVAYISEDMAINQDIKALIPKEGIDYYYLLSYLKYKEKELVSAYVKTGTTVESIIMNLFLKLEVPFPSYEEQIRISNVIRCNDKKLQALAEEVECWKEKKKALMQVLLTGTVRVKT